MMGPLFDLIARLLVLQGAADGPEPGARYHDWVGEWFDRPALSAEVRGRRAMLVLATTAQLRDELDGLIDVCVRDAREAGHTWEAIGAAARLPGGRQNAFKRLKRAIERPV